MHKLELTLSLNRSKTKEFKQSLEILTGKIMAISSTFELIESEDDLSFHLIIQWESDILMHQALQRDEFKILSGAINSLCDKTIIRFNDRVVGKNISKLRTIYQD